MFAGLGEGAREVLEHAVAVVAVDLYLRAEGGRPLPFPFHFGEALWGAGQRAGVGAVLVVDGDALAERDVADDRVAGYRATALGEPHHHVVDPVDLDPESA